VDAAVVDRAAAPRTAARPGTSPGVGRLAPIPLLGLALVAVGFLSLSIGAVPIGLTQVAGVLLDRIGLDSPWAFSATEQLVVLQIRLPRLILGALAGGGLAVSGAVMQGLFRNPLADPGLVGVSSGAALAVLLVLVVGTPVLASAPAWVAQAALAIGAFLGGAGTVGIVYRIATRAGRTSVATMLLAGIAVNALTMALVGLLIFSSDDQQLRDFTFWSLGSLSGAGWQGIVSGGGLLLVGILSAPLLARPLNAMLLGEAEARHLGVDVERLKIAVIAFATLAAGSAVALTGLIGFVGLVAPHLIRLSLGPDHRVLIPGSALLGAILLLGADLLARTVVLPAELPIGIVTALIGAPFFLWLLLRRSSMEWGG
jgi:iron complex transport system permease protein